MINEEAKIRLEKYKSMMIDREIKNFNDKSLKERIDYINELIEMNVNEYKRWLVILKIMSIKTDQFKKLKDFYERLDDNGKKEFQTELYETISKCEWDWESDYCIDDSDKILKPFYNLDTIDSKLEEIKKELFQEVNQDNRKYQKKLLNSFVDRCSGKVIDEFKKSIEDFVLIMKDNLSNSTKKKLFSLPQHMRVYTFMEMYNTAKVWNFEDWYLTDSYNYRQMERDIKKRKAKVKENKIKNSNSYVRRKYSIIKFGV